MICILTFDEANRLAWRARRLLWVTSFSLPSWQNWPVMASDAGRLIYTP